MTNKKYTLNDMLSIWSKYQCKYKANENITLKCGFTNLWCNIHTCPLVFNSETERFEINRDIIIQELLKPIASRTDEDEPNEYKDLYGTLIFVDVISENGLWSIVEQFVIRNLNIDLIRLLIDYKMNGCSSNVVLKYRNIHETEIFSNDAIQLNNVVKSELNNLIIRYCDSIFGMSNTNTSITVSDSKVLNFIQLCRALKSDSKYKYLIFK